MQANLCVHFLQVGAYLFEQRQKSTCKQIYVFKDPPQRYIQRSGSVTSLDRAFKLLQQAAGITLLFRTKFYLYAALMFAAVGYCVFNYTGLIVIYYVCGSWLHLFLGKASTASFGLHLNPLVSFGLFSLNCSKNRGSCRNLGIYLIVQITAALSAAFFVSHILPIGLHLLGPTSSLVRHSFARQVILRIFG